MNILLVVPEEFMAKRWGGVTSYTIDLAKALTTLNHQVRIVTPGKASKTTSFSGLVINKIAPRETGFLPIRLFIRTIGKGFPKLAGRLNWALAVRKFVKDNPKIDIVEAPEWGASSLFLPFSKKPKVIVRLHRSWIQYLVDNASAISLEDRLISLTEYFSIGCASGVTSPTHFMLNKYRHFLKVLGKKEGVTQVIPNAIVPLPVKKQKNDFGQYLLTVGRIERAKGSFLLAEAFIKVHKRYPFINLVYIGEDTEIAKGNKKLSTKKVLKDGILKKLHGKHVFFLPKIARSKLLPYYKNSLIYITPSIGHENPSLSLIEALVSKASVIAARTGGIPEVIKEGVNGLLFEPKNADDLANKILQLIKNTKLRNKLAKNALLGVTNIKTATQKTSNFYKLLLKSS